jgi:hypothetical protein
MAARLAAIANTIFDRRLIERSGLLHPRPFGNGNGNGNGNGRRDT